MVELDEMVSNKLRYVDFKSGVVSLVDRPAKTGCALKDFLKTRCYGDKDCQQCLNTSDAFCKDYLYCDYKTKWEMFPMRKLPKFGNNQKL